MSDQPQPIPEHFDELLESLDGARHGSSLSPPPAAFLRAVGRRRRRRIASRVTVSCAAVSIVFGLAVLSRTVLSPVPTPLHTPSQANATIPDTSARALALANRDVAPERLALPESPSTPMDLPLRVGDRIEPAQMQEWLGQ